MSSRRVCAASRVCLRVGSSRRSVGRKDASQGEDGGQPPSPKDERGSKPQPPDDNRSKTEAFPLTTLTSISRCHSCAVCPSYIVGSCLSSLLRKMKSGGHGEGQQDRGHVRG